MRFAGAGDFEGSGGQPGGGSSLITSVQGESQGDIRISISNIDEATLATLNSKITDATLDHAGDPRPPLGSARGDILGPFSQLRVVRINQIPIAVNQNAQANSVLSTSNNASRYEFSTFVRSIDNDLTGDVSRQVLADRMRTLIAPPEAFELTTDAPSEEDVPAAIGGRSYSLGYRVHNASSVSTVQLSGQLSGGSSVVLDADAPKLERFNTATVTVPSGVSLASAGDTYTLTLRAYRFGESPGASTPFSTLSHVITGRTPDGPPVEPPSTASVLHIGWVSATTAASEVVLSNLVAQATLSGTFTIPTTPLAGARLVFAYRSTEPDITSILITGRDQINFYNNNPSAITEGSIPYDVWLSGNPLPTADVAGEQVTIAR